MRKNLTSYYKECAAPPMSEIDGAVTEWFCELRKELLQSPTNDENRSILPFIDFIVELIFPLIRCYKVINKRLREEDVVCSQDLSTLPVDCEFTIKTFYDKLNEVSQEMVETIIKKLPCDGNVSIARNDLLQSITDKDFHKFEATIRTYNIVFDGGVKACFYITEPIDAEEQMGNDISDYLESKEDVAVAEDKMGLCIDEICDILLRYLPEGDWLFEIVRNYLKEKKLKEAFFTLCFHDLMALDNELVSKRDRLLKSDITRIDSLVEQKREQFPAIKDLLDFFTEQNRSFNDPYLAANRTLYETTLAYIDEIAAKCLPAPNEEIASSDGEEIRLLPAPSNEIEASDEMGNIAEQGENGTCLCNGFILPSELNSDKAIYIFNKAIQQGYILREWDKSCNKLTWTRKREDCEYMCGILYAGDTNEGGLWNGPNELTDCELLGEMFIIYKNRKKTEVIKTEFGRYRREHKNKGTLPSKHGDIEALFTAEWQKLYEHQVVRDTKKK